MKSEDFNRTILSRDFDFTFRNSHGCHDLEVLDTLISLIVTDIHGAYFISV